MNQSHTGLRWEVLEVLQPQLDAQKALYELAREASDILDHKMLLFLHDLPNGLAEARRLRERHVEFMAGLRAKGAQDKLERQQHAEEFQKCAETAAETVEVEVVAVDRHKSEVA